MQEILEKLNIKFNLIEGNFYEVFEKNLIFYKYKNSSILEEKYLFNKNNEFIQKLGKRLIIIYEDEIRYKTPLIENKIIHLMGLNKAKRIHGSKCVYKIITPKEKNIFLNKNHIQGADKSNVSIGAFYKEELVGVMTFDNNRNMNNGNSDKDSYELKRFATNVDYVLLELAKPLLDFFIETFKPNRIISFADRRWSDDINNLYINLGFKQTKKIDIDYYYVWGDEMLREHKFNYRKADILRKLPHLYNKDKTEKEMMEDAGFHRVWDIGKIKYELFFDDNNRPIRYFGLIYKITNTINNKIYIGQTARTLSQRKSEYFKDRYKSNEHLKNAFEKYGKNKFTFEEIDYAQNIEELNEKEIYWIKFYNCVDKTIGYNLHEGGRNCLLSDETKKKLSDTRRGRKQTPEWVAKRIPKAGTQEAKDMMGRFMTEEQKKHLSEITKGENAFWYGKKRDEETIDKIRKTKLENGLSKQVCRFDMSKNEIIDVWDSIEYGAKMTGVSPSTIKRHCEFKIKKYDSAITWRFYKELKEQLENGLVLENLYEKTKDFKRYFDPAKMKAAFRNRKKVKVTNLDNGEEEIFDSIGDCAKKFKYSETMVNYFCKGIHIPKINFKFEFFL